MGNSKDKGAGYFVCPNWRPGRRNSGCGWFCWESTLIKKHLKKKQQEEEKAKAWCVRYLRRWAKPGSALEVVDTTAALWRHC